MSRSRLKAKGMFRAFSDVHYLGNRVYVRQVLRAQFESFVVETPGWKNSPPAPVYTATRQISSVRRAPNEAPDRAPAGTVTQMRVERAVRARRAPLARAGF